MGKVIKILVHILSTVILTVIILPVLLSLLLNLSVVQNYAIQKATKFISNKLETTISIDRIGIRLFNRVVIDGLYVEDYAADTLLYTKKLSVDVTDLGILKGDIALGAVKLDSTKFYLRQMDSGISNLREILAKLKSDKPKSGKSFAMKVASLNIDDLTFTFRKLQPRSKPYGVNFDDLDVQHFSLDVSKVSIIDDSIVLAINTISLRDKSGFQVNSLSSKKFSISSTGMLFDRLKIETPDSKLNADFLYFTYPEWMAYSDFLTKVNIESKIVNSTVSYATIAYFAPSLRSWQSTYTDISANVNGTIDALSGSIEELKINDTELSAKFGLYGIPNIWKTRFAIDITKLNTNVADVDFILKDITKRSFVGNNQVLSHVGNIGLVGNFNGLLSRFKADAKLSTAIGDVKLKMQFSPDTTYKSAFAGDIDVFDVKLGKLLGNKQLGVVALKAKVDGKYGKKALTANMAAQLSKLEFNGYAYHDIALNGLIRNRTYEGLITSKDPNIRFDFNGLLDFNDSIPKFDFDLQLLKADLHKLNLNQRDSISQISCDFKATAQGNHMDNVNGVATIRNLLYVNHIDSVRTGEIRLVGDNDAEHKSLALHSSFADAQFKSRLGYNHMFNYLKSVLEEYLPMLTSTDESVKNKYASNSQIADIAGYSLLQVDVKEANNVAGIFLPGLQLAQGSKLSLMFNPDARKFSLSATSDYIEREDFFVSKLNINSRNEADSLSLFVRADDVFAGGMYLPNFSVIGGARDNRFNLSAKFHDPKTKVNALIGVMASLDKSASGIAQVRIRLTPSTFTNNNRTWRVTARDILYDTTQIAVNNFRILSSGQELMIDGVASKNSADTLRVRMKNFDLGPFSQLTSRAGYQISGLTNGYADVASALSEASVYARITMDSMKINQVSVPSTLFVSTWDSHNERAKITVSTEGIPEPVVLGYYRPNDGRYLVDINLRNVDLSLIDPVLSSVLKNSSGSADTHLTLTGTSRQPTLNGSVTVNQFATTVSYTNVPYTLNNATITVKDNNFTLNPTWVHDVKGNMAELEMTLGSTYFSNLHYDLRIRPKNLMVINTTLADNDLFYGTIFASGAAQIKGDKRGVNMNIVATTDDNSAFYMPLSGKANISEADFIIFDTPSVKSVDSTNYLVRKRMMFERKNKVFSTTKSNMNITMALTVKPNTDFQLVIDPTVGDILKGRGNGQLNIHINPNDNVFSMYGDYQITEGSYLFTLQNIINKKFVIQPGSTIKWTGEPLDALLDITAIYKVKASLAPLLSSNDENYRRSIPVDCQIHFADRLSQPAITFDVTVQNVDPETQSLVANALNTQEMMATQFFWLLAVNSFYADSGTGQSMNIGAMGGSVTGFEFLSNQLSNWISSDKYDIGIRYRPKSEISSDELDIGLSTAIIDNRLLLEVEGNYDFGNNSTMNNRTANSLTGDFYLTWLIDRAGNLKAKAFSRTIDRFDENQGLQESGIGIYYKEDFNSFKDIITNIKERFKKRSKTK